MFDYDFITSLGLTAGFDESILAKVALVSLVANAIGRLIPDSATGIPGFIRKVCKVIGIYVPNRITPQDSTVSVAKEVLADQVNEDFRK